MACGSIRIPFDIYFPYFEYVRVFISFASCEFAYVHFVHEFTIATATAMQQQRHQHQQKKKWRWKRIQWMKSAKEINAKIWELCMHIVQFVLFFKYLLKMPKNMCVWQIICRWIRPFLHYLIIVVIVLLLSLFPCSISIFRKNDPNRVYTVEWMNEKTFFEKIILVSRK